MAASTTLSVLTPLLCWRLLSSWWCCQLRWHCHPLCAGIIALIVLALSPLSCWHWCPCCTGFSVVCGVVYHVVRGLVHASSTRAKTPANRLHNTSTTRAKRVTATVTAMATATARATAIAMAMATGMVMVTATVTMMATAMATAMAM